MTLISWNGNGPILKNGSIGTQSACCCAQGPQCCCVGNTVTIVQSAQDCTGNIAAVPSTAIAINKISFAVDWDGLTGVTGGWVPVGGGNYGSSLSADGGADFSCKTPANTEPFDASSRSFSANFFGNTQGVFGPNCAPFSMNLTFIFGGTNSAGSGVIAQNFYELYLSLCRRQATLALDSNFSAWCPNPFGDSFTVEMIIAP